MATLLLGCAKGDNKVYRLDDPGLVLDEGVAFVPYLVTADVDFGPAGGQGRLRGITQAVALGGDATLTITPIANGGEVTAQAESQALVASAGTEQIVEQSPASMATRHALRIAASAFTGTVALGECDLELIKHQSRAKV